MAFLTKMVGIVVVGVLAATVSATEVLESQAVEAAALTADDQCAAGDAQCALYALQHRGVAVEATHKPSKTQDLSLAWENKIYAWIVYLNKNITLLQWRQFYYQEDINSTNNKLHGIKGVTGVNGTYIDWNNHNATWIPTFSSPEEKSLPSLAEIRAQSLLEANATEQDTEGTSSRHKPSMKGVPPRKKKMQQMLSVEQDRLNALWKDITIDKRKLNELGNYMGANRRLLHGKPVLISKQEAIAHGRILEASRHNQKWDADDEGSPVVSEPQTEFVNQIQGSLNQTSDLWGQLHTVGGMIMAMKHRVNRYMNATPVNLLEARAKELNELESWSHGGYEGSTYGTSGKTRHGKGRSSGKIHNGNNRHPFVQEGANMEHVALVLSDAEAVAQESVEPGTSLVEEASEDEVDWSIFGTTEQCCQCIGSGTVGWSASGKCSFCTTGATTKSVSSDCTVKSKNFEGNQACANSCKTVVAAKLLEVPTPWLQCLAEDVVCVEDVECCSGNCGTNYTCRPRI